MKEQIEEFNNRENIRPKSALNAKKDISFKDKILFEDESKREEAVKHFRLKDGTCAAIISQEPMHYFDKKHNKFLEIDNTLEEKIENGKRRFKNKHGRFNVAFAAENTDGESLVEIQQDQLSLSMEFTGRLQEGASLCRQRRNCAANIKAKTQSGHMADESIEGFDFNQNTLRQSEVVYADAATGVDLEYITSADKVKENIIVKQPLDSYQFEFKLKTAGLKAIRSDDKRTVDFVSDEAEGQEGADTSLNKRFYIPAPIMLDAVGAESASVHYELSCKDGSDENTGSRTYVFKVVANENWINAPERAFPVTIDPTVCFNYSYGGLATKTVARQGVQQYVEVSEPYRTIGRTSNDRAHRLAIAFPNINSDTDFISAGLILTKYSTAGSGVFSQIYEVFRNLSSVSLSSLTFNDTYDSFLSSNKMIDWIQHNSDQHYVDLTEYMSKVIAGEWPNNGILIRARYEMTSPSSDGYIRVHSENSSGGHPYMIINYRPNKGRSPNQSNHTNSLGRAGESGVNLRTGALTFAHKDLSTPDTAVIDGFYHVYCNNGVFNQHITNTDIAISPLLNMGENWKLNIQQALAYVPLTVGNENYRTARYVYVDAMGTERYLVEEGQDTNGDMWYVDENGMGLRLKDGTNTLIDANKNEYHFDAYNNMLIKIKSPFNKEVDIVYSSDRIVAVSGTATGTKGPTNVFSYTFQYNGSGKLNQISSAAGQTINFIYQNNLLWKIAYQDGGETEFTYSGNKLTSASNATGKSASYQYSGNKVVSVAENAKYSAIAGGSTTTAPGGQLPGGQSVSINYCSPNMTVVTDNKEIRTVYNFDSRGRTITAYEDKSGGDPNHIVPAGNIAYNSFDDSRQISARISDAPENLLNNGELQKGSGNKVPEGWHTGYTSGEPIPVYGFTSDYTVNGNNSFRMYGDPTYKSYISQSVNGNSFEIGKVYVLSAWAKADSMDTCSEMKKNTMPGIERNFKISAYVKYAGQVWAERYDALFDPQNRDWQMAAVAFKAKKQVQYVDVLITYYYNANEACFGNARLACSPATITEDYISLREQAGTRKLYNLSDISEIEYQAIYGGYSTESRFYISPKDMRRMVRAYEKGNYAVSLYDTGKDIIDRVKNTPFTFIMNDNVNIPIASVVLNRVTDTNTGTLQIEEVTDSNDESKTVMQRIFDSDNNTFDTVNEFNDKNQLLKSTDYRGIITEYEYDIFGNNTKTVRYHEGDSPATDAIIQECKYDEAGRFMEEKYDERQNDSAGRIKASYDYNTGRGLVDTATAPNGQETSYGYNQQNDNLTSVSSNVGSFANVNGFGYYRDLVTSVSHNGFEYGFIYNGWGEITKVAVAYNEMLTKAFTYGDVNNDYADTETVNYDGGASLTKEYDKYGRLTGQREGVTVKTQNVYDSADSGARLIERVDNYAGLTYTMDYDADGDISGVSFTGDTAGTIAYGKDGRNRVAGADYSLSGSALNYTCEYEKDGQGNDYPDNRLWKTNLTGKFSTAYGYDNLGRLDSKAFTRAGGGLTIGEAYEYQDALDAYGAKIGTTGYISRVTQKVNGSIQDAYEYEYDRNGNIKKITGGPQSVVSYEYDNLNRLTSERIGVNGPETNWTYDAGGNITSKSVDGFPAATYRYANGWADQLTHYNDVNENIFYDACGNPTEYLGANLTWARGRILDTYSKGGTTCNYTYNAEGYRVKKVVNGVEHKYWLEGNRILKETFGDPSDLYCGQAVCGRAVCGVGNAVSDTLLYYYDAAGICGMNHNGMDYYFRKNLQGDVTHILDISGTIVAQYAYDAWGCCTIGTNLNNIATINPFRYRGYYYDSETGLYYLNSRYYDPTVGRFINADTTSCLEPAKLNGLNLYSYCGDNPVNNIDENGRNWKKILTKIALIATAVAVVVVGVGLIATGVGIAVLVGIACVSAATSAVINGFANEAAGGDFASGFIGGFVGGFVSGMIPIPVVDDYLGSGLASLITDHLDRSLGLNSKTDQEIWDDAHNSGLKSIPASFLTALTGIDIDFGINMNTLGDLEDLPIVKKILDWFNKLFGGGNNSKYGKVF